MSDFNGIIQSIGRKPYPETLQELLTWPDRGTYQAKYVVIPEFTGYEGEKGKCAWCGEEVKAGRTYCKGHGIIYHRHFNWSEAFRWCLTRYEHKCANCGRNYRLNVHHINPLNGYRPQYSLYHLPWNLICLCFNCHVELHNIMRRKNNTLLSQSVMRLEV